MQISDTRKEIINLISDYMDKTLSEWCLVECDTYIITIREYDTIKNEDWYNHIYRNWESYEVINKIIWHYDITAVLKYFKLKHWLSDLFIMKHSIIFLDKWKAYFDIPNKPLHLYTEEEEKRLLDLLINIK